MDILHSAARLTARHAHSQDMTTQRLQQRNHVIREAVIVAGHTQTAVAVACGLSRESVSKIVRQHAPTEGAHQ